MEVQVEETV